VPLDKFWSEQQVLSSIEAPFSWTGSRINSWRTCNYVVYYIVYTDVGRALRQCLRPLHRYNMIRTYKEASVLDLLYKFNRCV